MAENNFDPYETLSEASELEIRDLRVGDKWYEMGSETDDGKLIAYFPEKDAWEQVGNKSDGNYEFYDIPTQEFYRHPYLYALNNHETAKWESSENLNLQCKSALGSAIASSFNNEFNALDVNALNDVVQRFGTERTAYVLAKSIIDFPGDSRISMENRSWAVAVDANFGDLDYMPSLSNQFLFLPIKKANAAIDLFKMQTHYDPTVRVMNSDMDPYPFVYPFTYKTAEFNNELPEYLWSWRINCRCADSINGLINPDEAGPVEPFIRAVIQNYGTERVSVVLGATLNLYASRPDISDENKEWLKSVDLPAANIPEISGYMIQATSQELNEFLNQCLPVLQNEIDKNKEAEEIVLCGSPVSDDRYFYSIYQDTYSGIKDRGNSNFSDFNMYESVYNAESKGWSREGAALNDIYDSFCDHRPADFLGYSLSMGDIIVLNHNGNVNAFLINSNGFEELPGFVQTKKEENSLTRQNDILIEPDGRGAR